VSGFKTNFTGLFKDATFGPFSNLHTCISLSGSLSLWTMPGLKIFAHVYLFLLACFRAFSNAANSCFWCGDPKVFLQGSLKMLVLALPQIYTNVFHLWKSMDLDSA